MSGEINRKTKRVCSQFFIDFLLQTSLFYFFNDVFVYNINNIYYIKQDQEYLLQATNRSRRK